MSAEARDSESSEGDARQETVAFETVRPRSVPPSAPELLDAVSSSASLPTRDAPDKREKKQKAARQETKPFAVVRDAGAAAEAPPEAAATQSVVSAVGEIASEAREVAEGVIAASGQAGAAAKAGVSRQIARAEARAQQHFDGERAEWRDAEDDSALPDVLPGEPLADLAVRIDREADFWRAFAIRALRPGGPRNVSIIAASVAIASAVILGVVGAFGAIFGIESAGIDLVETSLAIAGLLLSAVLIAAFVEGTRREAAARALGRAEVLERRLERVAAILELKKTDDTRYREALARLERDPTR